jgi:predicted AAA+ superfamily ATPase
MVIERTGCVRRVRQLLREHPIVAILGARQVGKTTLAHQVVAGRAHVSFLDLEDPRVLSRLAEPTLALGAEHGIVVLDEVQNRPDLFPVLRVLADRRPLPARFLVLGSASPHLLRQGSETLAGRVAFHELGGFDLGEVGADELDKLWFRGGFPRSYLARSHRASNDWRRDFVRTFVSRDLPQLGASLPVTLLDRFWTMLAHYHGQIWNASEFAASFGVSAPTVRHYLDLLAGAFVVTLLRPWAENVGKRVVKAPKVYISDSGLLHTLLGLASPADLERHPKLGASWEGFLLTQVVRALRAQPEQRFFWATHAGAELDLLVTAGSRRLGFEFKRTDAPVLTRSMRSAMETLKLDRLDIVHAGADTFALGPQVRALAARDLSDRLKPLPS